MDNNFFGQKNNNKKLESNTHLTKFVLLAESAKEPNFVIDIIKQTLESPSIHVFGELLDVANIKALNGTEYDPYLKLLNIFAYGTYQDYKKQKYNSPMTLPDLTEPMANKLRQLTMVSLARCRRHIPYQILLQELDLTSIRQLEDLIIQAIYANIIKGTMDQQNNRLEIDQTIARDVREEDFNTIINVLKEWCGTCENILSNIQHQIQAANNFKEETMHAKQEFEEKIQMIRKTIKPSENDDPMTGNMYSRDAGEKAKRGPYKTIKCSYKFSNTKCWRKEV